MKRTQITIYFIIGLTIIIFLGIFLFYSYSTTFKGIESETDALIIEQQSDQIKNYVEQCLYNTASKGIYLIGLQGGYIDPEYNEYYGDYDQVQWERRGFLKTPYWYYNGKDISPSLEQIETRLGRYILVEGINCTNFKSMFSLDGTEIILTETNYQANHFDFSKEKSFINISINEKDITVHYFFPITLKRDKTEKIVSDFLVEIPIAFGENYQAAKQILSNIKNSERKGYNIENDCNKFNRGGYTNLYAFNNMVLLIDYEPLLNLKNEKSFKLEYLFSGAEVYGYCSG